MIPTPHANIYEAPTTIHDRYDRDSILQLNPRIRVYSIEDPILDKINDVVQLFNTCLKSPIPAHGDYILHTDPVAEVFNRHKACSVVDTQAMDRYPGDRWLVSMQMAPDHIPEEYSLTLGALVYRKEPLLIEGAYMDLLGYTTRPICIDNYPSSTQMVMFYIPVKVWYHHTSS
jgi:hypothetical protein